MSNLDLPQPDRQAGAAAIDAFAQQTARDLRGLQIKMTYVGTQRKAVPSVVFSTFYQLVNLESFASLRRPGFHYGNDDSALWNFTVTPEEMERIVKSLRQKIAQQAPGKIESPALSLMLVLRDTHYHGVFAQSASAVLVQAIIDELDPDNGVGRKVLALRQQAD